MTTTSIRDLPIELTQLILIHLEDDPVATEMALLTSKSWRSLLLSHHETWLNNWWVKCNIRRRSIRRMDNKLRWHRILCLAARDGLLNILRFLKKEGCCPGSWQEGDKGEEYFKAKLPSLEEHLCSSAAALGGHLEVLQWLVEEAGCPLAPSAAAAAAQGGHLEVLQWLVKDAGCPWNEWTLSRAAREGHLEVMKWAKENGCTFGRHSPQFIRLLKLAEWKKEFLEESSTATINPTLRENIEGIQTEEEVLHWVTEDMPSWRGSTCREAAKAGKLEILQWAIEEGFPVDKRIVTSAAAGGHLSILQWVIDEKKLFEPGPDLIKACHAAARRGQIAALDWLHFIKGIPWSVETCQAAAFGGQLECLQWLRSNECPWDSETPCYAARRGHLDVIRWAKDNGCPIDLAEVASHGPEAPNPIEILEWAIEAGLTRLEERLTIGATCRNDLDLLKWLKGKGYPMAVEAALFAGKDMEILTWMIDQGWPLHDDTFRVAVESLVKSEKDLEIMEYLLAKGCPWSVDTCTAPATTGFLPALKWLREKGCPWDDSTTFYAARHGHIHILEWAREHGCPFSENASRIAAERGQVEVLKWLHANGYPMVSARSLQTNHVEVMKWAIEINLG